MEKDKAEIKSIKFKNYTLGLAGILSAILIPLIGFLFTQSQKNQEIEKSYVELGIKILSEQPKEGRENLRSWAVELVNKYSEIKFKDTTKQDLIKDIPLVTKKDYGSEVNQTKERLDTFEISNNLKVLGYILIPHETNLFYLYLQDWDGSTKPGSTIHFVNNIDKNTLLMNLGKYIDSANSIPRRLIISAFDETFGWNATNRLKWGTEKGKEKPLKNSKMWSPQNQEIYNMQGCINCP